MKARIGDQRLLIFMESIFQKIHECLRHFFLLPAADFEDHLAAALGCQHHHAHDAFTVDLQAVLADDHLCVILRSRLHEEGRRPGVKS